MGLVYAFLAAWVIGGVLLGARILIVQREAALPEASSSVAARVTVLGAAGLLGFGLFGLVAEGLGWASGPSAAGWAALGSVLFLAGTYALAKRPHVGVG
jgi:hypothetical protein